LTIVNILAPEYDVTDPAAPVLTGNILSGTTGGVVTNIGSPDALGIANPSISNTNSTLSAGETKAMTSILAKQLSSLLIKT